MSKGEGVEAKGESIGSPDSAIVDDSETSHEKTRRCEDSDSDAQSLGGRARVRRTFWNRYEEAVAHYLSDMRAEINVRIL